MDPCIRHSEFIINAAIASNCCNQYRNKLQPYSNYNHREVQRRNYLRGKRGEVAEIEKSAEKSGGLCRQTGSLTNLNKGKWPPERGKRIDEWGAAAVSAIGVEQRTRTFSPPSGHGRNPPCITSEHPHNTTPWCCIDPSPCRIQVPLTCQKLRDVASRRMAGEGEQRKHKVESSAISRFVSPRRPPSPLTFRRPSRDHAGAKMSRLFFFFMNRS